MESCPVRSIIEKAEEDTSAHLLYLRRSIRMGLLFTIVIILIDVVNILASSGEDVTADYLKHEVLAFSPNPVLLIGLLISVAIQFHLLRRIRSNYADIQRIREHRNLYGTVSKSITDINYDIIGAVNVGLRTWPVIGFLFVIYFIGCIGTTVEYVTGEGAETMSGLSIVLGLTTVVISVYVFITQTSRWRSHRKKMKELERMEKKVLEELDL